MLDMENVVTEIEDALSGNLAKAGHVYRMSLNGLKDKALKDALALLKELDAAYQGATELLRQKTILFDDAIKRLKEQQERIETLESLRRIEHEGR